MTGRTEKQQAMDFMEAQGLAIKIIEITRGQRVGVIGQALAIVLATFVKTCGFDPAYMLNEIMNGAIWHANQAGDPPEKTN